MLRFEYYLTMAIINFFCPKGMLFFLGRVGQGKDKSNVCACLRMSAVKKILYGWFQQPAALYGADYSMNPLGW